MRLLDGSLSRREPSPPWGSTSSSTAAGIPFKRRHLRRLLKLHLEPVSPLAPTAPISSAANVASASVGHARVELLWQESSFSHREREQQGGLSGVGRGARVSAGRTNVPVPALRGFPVWLKNLPGTNFRMENEPFKGFSEKIVDMMKSEKLFASQGGPIIFSQAELQKEKNITQIRIGLDVPIP